MKKARPTITSTAGRMAEMWLRTPFGSPNRLRVLAFHAILDAAGFERQMEHLASTYTPVSSQMVLDALVGGSLPPRAVWVTFDDGDPSVIERGLPVLQRHGIEATMFVCPAMVDTDEPYWWQVIEVAAEHEISYDGEPVTAVTLGRLKQMPDDERRSVVTGIRGLLEERLGDPLRRRQLNSSELRKWLEAGQWVGNHTWDHPMLDRCDPGEQERQITLAHDWMVEQLGKPPVLFAYPNGNWTGASEEILRSLGYQVGLLFDHRLTRLDAPLRMSRIRVTADGDLDRFKAMVSGLHPFVHRLRGRS